MTIKELEVRVAALEREVADLREQRNGQPSLELNPVHWWRTQAGVFANDPVFDEIVRLGKEYRDLQHPDSLTRGHNNESDT